jgi:1,2-diacylglycerol 3-alpha-glucosyltransferase
METKVAMLSAGLGNISRGFETSTTMWFNEIKNKDGISVKLFSGGNYENAIKIWNLPRNGYIASFLRKLNLIKDGCKLEQISFSIGFLIYLIRYRPDIIWLQEGVLGSKLIGYRTFFRFKYKIVFCDGAPTGHVFAKRFDFLIFLHQKAIDGAIKDGVEPARCSLIPYLTILPTYQGTKANARELLHIDKDKFVIICAAAWNRHHKRIDYLLNEISHLSHLNITLLICGQPESDSVYLQDLAAQLEGIEVKWYTFNQQDLSIAYSAADIFVLPSLHEGLGIVMIEAAQHKLPVICNDHEAGRFIFGEQYFGLTDLSIKGNLAKKIALYKNSDDLKEMGLQTEEIVNKKFDRRDLTEKFIGIIKTASLN